MLKINEEEARRLRRIEDAAAEYERELQRRRLDIAERRLQLAEERQKAAEKARNERARRNTRPEPQNGDNRIFWGLFVYILVGLVQTIFVAFLILS